MNKPQLQEKLLQETKYSKWYLDIIENALSQNRTKLKKIDENYQYYENHHILPESMFKEFNNLKENPWNGILLTAREHFIAHLCIWKHYKSIEYTHGEIKMSRAMTSLNNMGEYNSKHYECFRLNLTVSKETKKKISESKKGHDVSSETRKKISEGNKGNIASEETKKKISESHKGSKPTKGMTDKTHSVESKKKISESLKGRNVSEETKKKISESLKGVKRGENKIVKCPHCGLKGGINVMQRWHFNNCKLNKLNNIIN